MWRVRALLRAAVLCAQWGLVAWVCWAVWGSMRGEGADEMEEVEEVEVVTMAGVVGLPKYGLRANGCLFLLVYGVWGFVHIRIY